jgi:pyruvate dehydrogenase E1 component alpha subunit
VTREAPDPRDPAAASVRPVTTGPADDRSPALLGTALLERMLEEMIAARVASRRLWNLQRQGRIPLAVPIDGQEAVTVGAVHALDPSVDWVLPQYREPIALRPYGEDTLERAILYLLGHPEGGHHPAPTRVFPHQISLATQIVHAVGVAWGLQLRGEPGVALVFFGDGSTSEGDFAEAANLAGVLRAPVIFVCPNNQWAISTPLRSQTAAASIADKAVAFGFPGVVVDGMDAAAVHEAVAAARARAVGGDGPTLIEAACYRFGAHTSSDDPTRYVPPEELAAARERDPLLVLRHRLEALGRWDDARQQTAEADALARFDAAYERAVARPVDPLAMFDHVFAEPTPRQRRQRAELAARLRTETP